MLLCITSKRERKKNAANFFFLSFKKKKKRKAPADLMEGMSSIMYAAPRLEIPELREVKNKIYIMF